MPQTSSFRNRAMMAEELNQHPLVKNGIVSDSVFKRAATVAMQRGACVELTLNEMGALSDNALASYFSEQLGYRRVSPPSQNPIPEILPMLNLEFLRHHQILPMRIFDQTVELGMVNPRDQIAIDGIRFALRRQVDPVILEPSEWRKCWAKWCDCEMEDEASHISDDAERWQDQNRDAPIVRKVSGWIETAADVGASDVHFEARPYGLDVIYRVDGQLRTIATEPKQNTPSIISRLKVISGLDLGVRHKPQDGRASIVIRGRKLDIRTSILPSVHGESVVLRLLDKPEGLLSLELLGFSDEHQKILDRVVHAKEGLFLVSGPTGSGKTTTLYACIERLKGKGLKILSVEDPIEYQFDHVTQVQVSEKAGLGFADCLRAFLRHDPEVIFVGEIRDTETAQMAVQAAYTGHLVLASIHAISADKVANRLESMGVESFKLKACMMGALSQRLVRRLCENCKEKRLLDDDEKALFVNSGLTVPLSVYEPVGCPKCESQGFKGRKLISEVSLTNDTSTEYLELFQHGLMLVSDGELALDDVRALSLQ